MLLVFYFSVKTPLFYSLEVKESKKMILKTEKLSQILKKEKRKTERIKIKERTIMLQI